MLYFFQCFFTVVAKHNKLDTGTSVFHVVGTLREDASDGVILVSSIAS